MCNRVSVTLREDQETPWSEEVRVQCRLHLLQGNPTLILCRVRSISTACTHTDTPALL